MSYPNVSNYIHTNKVNIDELKLDIIESAKTAISDERFQVVENLTQNITRAMGDFWFSVDGTIPAGGLPHLGHLVSRVLYQDFYVWLEGNKILLTDEEWLAYAEANGGCCPYYSSGDGSTTFRTPSYPDTFLKVVNDMNGASVYQKEGLPNITGHIRTFTEYNKSNASFASGMVGGAFYWQTSWDTDSSKAYSTSTNLASGSSDTARNVPFDASRCSSIYGNSEHVTPKNISMLIGVYAVGAIVPVGVTDAEKLMSGVTRVERLLDTKVDKTSPYITEQWSNGFSWYRMWSNGWIEQGGKLTPTSGGQDVTLFKEYSTTTYSVQATSCDSANHRGAQGWAVSTTVVKIRATSGSSASSTPVTWYTYGY